MRCPQNNLVETAPKDVLAVLLKDDETFYKSTSSSAFGGIAEAWINDGALW